MAKSDYRLCDKCGGKAFYDAHPSYTYHREPPESEIRYVGKGGKYPTLDYLGDWAVLCTDCAKTHRCVIVPIERGHHNCAVMQVAALKAERDAVRQLVDHALQQRDALARQIRALESYMIGDNLHVKWDALSRAFFVESLPEDGADSLRALGERLLQGGYVDGE